MALPTYIQDPATGRRIEVNPEGALRVEVVQGAASNIDSDVLTRRKLLRNFLRNASDSKDLNVDGSTTSVEFRAEAATDRTKFITGARVLFNGTNLEMNSNDFRRFGNATSSQTPLTNGLEFFVVQGGQQTNLFIDPIVRMGDFYNYSDDSVNIINAISSQSDFLYFDFDFDAPIAIPPATLDRIVMRVRDDLTAIDLFNVIVRGYQELVE